MVFVSIPCLARAVQGFAEFSREVGSLMLLLLLLELELSIALLVVKAGNGSMSSQKLFLFFRPLFVRVPPVAAILGASALDVQTSTSRVKILRIKKSGLQNIFLEIETKLDYKNLLKEKDSLYLPSPKIKSSPSPFLFSSKEFSQCIHAQRMRAETFVSKL